MQNQLLKTIFFGTSEFAVPALKKLKQAGYEIVAVITQPDKPVGRRQELIPSPVKRAALELGLKILQPPHLSSPTSGEELKEGNLFVVASYGKIIPKEILDIPKYGSLNIHASLLPKYRGASPIHAAILNGDTETGVTIIKMDEKVDHGPIIDNLKFKIQNPKIKFKELHDKLAELGVDLLIEILPKYISGEIKPVPQDHDKATFTKLISKEDGRIDWNKPAEEIERMVRAYEQWPVAWTVVDGKRIKIYEADLSPNPSPGLGRVVADRERSKLFVGCASGALEIKTLQEEGGKKMATAEYLRGRPDSQIKSFI